MLLARCTSSGMPHQTRIGFPREGGDGVDGSVHLRFDDRYPPERFGRNGMGRGEVSRRPSGLLWTAGGATH